MDIVEEIISGVCETAPTDTDISTMQNVGCSADEEAVGDIDDPITDTLIDPDTSALLHDKVVNVAPGEGNRPIGILLEERSFPSLFCGHGMKAEGDHQSYAMLCRWHLWHTDRRFASCIANIFFKYKELQAKKILSASGIGVRKGTKQKCLTADK